ncbi:MAG: hypothetical protein A3H01_00770 [Candidatus Wildermuthbacteria bacterium RIFCSPLOWO2_12_FULL_40_9]|uniref:GIY-YIG domain-containing protein n=2 Tax=Candidatus Wildermuthiibacteriota TaxID=1817923 RepID=A0A1G2RBV5_9BACT|nr:MAG: hypothetical protein A3F15_02650 [Candidatus Wildermuthbacteria bacterium RIFCSPHIGHO2_12_FULL_40_12]OHA76795.1 MAG: hypothetical protein A3H01_00770 [Candidatus Wildermuthbacteria bacterium RIFCSPLOWO2_12_FULL_40_9]
MWSVYIIRSIKKKWYYVGSTNRLIERISEHNKGLVRSTKHFLPFQIVYTKEFNSGNDDRKYERKLKDKRIEKETMIKKIENS